jgi:class 3 adenylate cyclase
LAFQTPKYLAERISTSKPSLEPERKQVTVLFADLKSSLELLAGRDPEDARKLLDTVLERMVAAVHRYEGTVNHFMGDGIMALFGAPLAQEDHAVRACFAALLMQEMINRHSDELRRTEGIQVQVRVGLNSGEVVLRTIRSDFHVDYTAVGETVHLAARMEQIATPGSILAGASVFKLVQTAVDLKSLGALPIKGLAAPVEVYEGHRRWPVPLAPADSSGARPEPVRRARRGAGSAAELARIRGRRSRSNCSNRRRSRRRQVAALI